MKAFTSRRARNALVAGAAAAMLFTGAGVALSQTNALATGGTGGGSSAPVTVNEETGASISTTATDKADGDHVVVKDGVIKDVVTYTGLHPGTIYVLHTQLFNKTDNVLLPYTGALIFTPQAADGSVTVEIPVPAGLEGKDLVVYQTIYAGADALVGKHLDKVEVRPGAKPVVQENNPGNDWQRVTVKKPITEVCSVSGTVWQDANNDGIMGADETRVPGVDVTYRTLPSGDVYPGTMSTYSAVTDANGFYKISFTKESDCGRGFIDFNETKFTSGWYPFSGGESDLKPGNENGGWSTPFTLVPGQHLERVDAGLRDKSKTTIVTGNFCAPWGMEGYEVSLVNMATGAVEQKVWAQGTSPAFTFHNVPVGQRYVVKFMKGISGDHGWVLTNGQSIDYYDKLGVWGGKWWVMAQSLPFTTVTGQPIQLTGCGYVTPIALDLNGDGKINTSNVADQPAGAAFDLLGTGSPVASGWLAGGDGFLVEPSADGSVTSIDNLFGGALGEGYAKLADRDLNADGKLTGAELAGLKVWVDADGDHVARSEEIKDLADYAITSVSVNFVNAPVADNGNAVIEHSVAGTATGGSIVMGDAYFAVGAVNDENAAALSVFGARSEAALSALPQVEANAIREALAQF
ncbi:VaFE repeat-containing surface-anchored protein [Micrococcales bacterium 31B]|nr:VaFE repeat-containing surface-anchored protein [Micrococcales bacterium 31B]